MRELVRLLLVAVLSFVVVGVAVVYSRDSHQLRQLSAILGPGETISQSVIRPETADVAALETGSEIPLWIPRPSHGVWMGLAGFPDQYEVRFPVPQGISLLRGSLELEFESELAEHGDGRMTILVNGERRGEIVLNTGREMHKASIALDAEDLLGSQLVLELSGRGTTNSGQICPSDSANSGAAITLLPSSGLALYTDDMIDQPDILLATQAETLRLALGRDKAEQAAAIWAGQILERAGLKVQLSEDRGAADLLMGPDAVSALSFDSDGRLVVGGRAGLDRIVALRMPVAASVSSSQEWPVPAHALGAETLAKNFRGSRRWTLPYKLADLPDGRTPSAIEINLKTSTLSQDNDWVVRVSFNGNLLKTERFPGALDTISMAVDLPAELQLLSNSVLVELIDTTPNDSICRAGPDAQAQLLPTTQLIDTGAQPGNGWPAMVRALAGAGIVGLTADAGLLPVEAHLMRVVLSSFLPIHAEMAFGTESGDVQLTAISVERVMASLDIAARISGQAVYPKSGLYFVVGNFADGSSEPTLIDLSDTGSLAQLAALHPDDLGILIAR